MYEVNFDDTIADGIENNAKDGGLSTENSLLNISSGCTLVALLRRGYRFHPAAIGRLNIYWAFTTISLKPASLKIMGGYFLHSTSR